MIHNNMKKRILSIIILSCILTSCMNKQEEKTTQVTTQKSNTLEQLKQKQQQLKQQTIDNCNNKWPGYIYTNDTCIYDFTQVKDTKEFRSTADNFPFSFMYKGSVNNIDMDLQNTDSKWVITYGERISLETDSWSLVTVGIYPYQFKNTLTDSQYIDYIKSKHWSSKCKVSISSSLSSELQNMMKHSDLFNKSSHVYTNLLECETEYGSKINSDLYIINPLKNKGLNEIIYIEYDGDSNDSNDLFRRMLYTTLWYTFKS